MQLLWRQREPASHGPCHHLLILAGDMDSTLATTVPLTVLLKHDALRRDAGRATAALRAAGEYERSAISGPWVAGTAILFVSRPERDGATDIWHDLVSMD